MTATFSAALLAGGKSRRMGRDKALLPVAGHSVLWRRQIALLRELQPRHIFWSGPAREGLDSTIRVVPDGTTDAGPLAGIAACLAILEDDLLLVLAVDLPAMNAAFLRRLLAACAASRGVVPRLDDRYEPLAAVYPKAMAPLAQAHLDQKRLALQDFVSAGIAAGLLAPHDVSETDRPCFLNLNRPEHLA